MIPLHLGIATALKVPVKARSEAVEPSFAISALEIGTKASEIQVPYFLYLHTESGSRCHLRIQNNAEFPVSSEKNKKQEAQ
jgi:hypothetical protein